MKQFLFGGLTVALCGCFYINASTIYLGYGFDSTYSLREELIDKFSTELIRKRFNFDGSDYQQGKIDQLQETVDLLYSYPNFEERNGLVTS